MITILGMALGVLLLVVPMLVAYIYKIDVVSKVLVAFVKMVARIGIFGVVLHFLFLSNSVWLTLASMFLFMMFSAVTVIVRARLRFGMFVIPVCGGMMVSVLVASAVLLFANVVVDSNFCMRYVLPVVAMLSGCVIKPMADALSVYYMGLCHHNHLYYYLIGNGASHAEALAYLQRRAIESSLSSGLRTMTTVAVGVSPMVMWSMIMCGRSAVEAAGWQMLFVLASMASTVVAVIVAMYLARHYVIDGYARIKALAVAVVVAVAFNSCGNAVKRIDAKIAESKAVLTNVDGQHGHNENASVGTCQSLEIPAPLVHKPEQILRRRGYTVSYNSVLRVPNWVAWHLTAAHVNGNAKRSGTTFREDTDVPEPRAVDFDYVRSGYDRGHMCPAGDNKWSQQAMDESFLLTNVCPQAPSLNRGDWNEMEQACRKWAKQYGDIYIVCGPVFYRKRPLTIGKDKVAVPDAFFKVVLVMKGRPRAIGFIYKNADGNRPKGDYANLVDEVERITGLDFFPSLPDDVERRIEAECQLEAWNI